MDRKYIFFVDVDETLIETGKTDLAENIIQEIDRLKAAGHIFVVSTGRTLDSLLAIKGIEVFQYLSILHGQCIYRSKDKKLLKAPNAMPKEDVIKLVDTFTLLHKRWSYKTIYIEKSMFNDFQLLRKQKTVKFIDNDEYIKDLNDGNILQMMLEGYLTQEEKDKFKNITFYPMPLNYTDITLKTASKAKCIEFFKQIYPEYTTVSIGDSHNDVPMFENTDISIAMGNSSPEIQSRTTYVTKHLKENGLIYAFRNILKL